MRLPVLFLKALIRHFIMEDTRSAVIIKLIIIEGMDAFYVRNIKQFLSNLFTSLVLSLDLIEKVCAPCFNKGMFYEC